MNKSYVRILYNNKAIYGKFFTNKNKPLCFWYVPSDYPFDIVKVLIKDRNLNYKKFYE